MRFQNTIAQSIEANDYTATRFLPERGHRMKTVKEKKNDGETDFLPMRRNASFFFFFFLFFISQEEEISDDPLRVLTAQFYEGEEKKRKERKRRRRE